MLTAGTRQPQRLAGSSRRHRIGSQALPIIPEMA